MGQKTAASGSQNATDQRHDRLNGTEGEGNLKGPTKPHSGDGHPAGDGNGGCVDRKGQTKGEYGQPVHERFLERDNDGFDMEELNG